MQNEPSDSLIRLDACARKLRRHGFEAVIAGNLAEAGRLLRDEIGRCAPQSISYGDSVTLRATGIVDELRSGRQYEFIDGFDPAFPRPEQLEVRRRGLLSCPAEGRRAAAQFADIFLRAGLQGGRAGAA